MLILLKRVLKGSFLILGLAIASHNPQAWGMYDPTTYRATDPTFPVTYNDVQKTQQRTDGASMMNALVAAANAGQSHYTIAPGVYRITGNKYQLTASHFSLNCTNVEIWLDPDVNGACRWLNLVNCTGVSINGPITFDCDTLQFVQGTVTGFNAVNGTVDMQVMAGYEVTNFPASSWIFWHYNTNGINLTRPGYTACTNYNASDLTQKRLTVGTAYFKDAGNLLKTGDLLLLRNGTGNSQPINMTGCRDITLNGLRCYFGPMWFSGECQGTEAS